MAQATVTGVCVCMCEREKEVENYSKEIFSWLYLGVSFLLCDHLSWSTLHAHIVETGPSRRTTVYWAYNTLMILYSIYNNLYNRFADKLFHDLINAYLPSLISNISHICSIFSRFMKLIVITQRAHTVSSLF